jgi:hypothetical protein
MLLWLFMCIHISPLVPYPRTMWDDVISKSDFNSVVLLHAKQHCQLLTCMYHEKSGKFAL